MRFVNIHGRDASRQQHAKDRELEKYGILSDDLGMNNGEDNSRLCGHLFTSFIFGCRREFGRNKTTNR